MSTLVLVEHNNQVINPAALSCLTAALEFGEPVTLLVLGYECRAVAEQAAALYGVHHVLYLDNPAFKHHVAEPVTEVLLSVASDFKAILGPASTYGKNIMPRLAALLDVAQVSDVTAVLDKTTFEHPIYAGNVIETVSLLDVPVLMTIRSTAFNPVLNQQKLCAIESLNIKVTEQGSTFIENQLSVSERPDLGSAKRVVSGGRGLQSAEQFKLVEDLADVLGAAVGASRAAVDAGFVPNDYQVGQTGKVVAPELYIALGISGAVQHLAGMKDSKVIVAINKDPDAPIFQVADYGLVGDVFELVPELIEQLKHR